MLKLLALCVLLPGVFAADWSRLRPQGYVSDFARVLPPSSRQSIEAYLARVEQATGAQIAIVTVKSLEGDPVEDVANRLYRSFGVGKKETDEGALFLISIGDRRTRLEVGYGLEPVLPDAAAGDILRAMRPALREKQYGPALETAAHTLGERIAAAKGVKIGNTPRRTTEPPMDFPGPALLVFLALVLLLGLFQRRHSRYRRWGGPWVFPGGGGFGGASSAGGSSWGGFGGGDSGGGGASSDW